MHLLVGSTFVAGTVFQARKDKENRELLEMHAGPVPGAQMMFKHK